MNYCLFERNSTLVSEYWNDGFGFLQSNCDVWRCLTSASWMLNYPSSPLSACSRSIGKLTTTIAVTVTDGAESAAFEVFEDWRLISRCSPSIFARCFTAHLSFKVCSTVVSLGWRCVISSNTTWLLTDWSF